MSRFASHWAGRLVVLGMIVTVASCAHMGGSSRTAAGVTVKDVDLGSAADSVKIEITSTTHDFKTTDRVFATVKYDNPSTSDATLNLKWFNGTNQVGDNSVTARVGQHADLFELHPTAPLTAGEYKLEVYVNATLVETKTFDVK